MIQKKSRINITPKIDNSKYTQALCLDEVETCHVLQNRMRRRTYHILTAICENSLLRST